MSQCNLHDYHELLVLSTMQCHYHDIMHDILQHEMSKWHVMVLAGLKRALPDEAEPPKVPFIVQGLVTWPRKLIEKMLYTDFIIIDFL